MIEFDPQPAVESLPTRLASPFRHAVPHPLARDAAESLQAELHRRGLPDMREGGKMFGVLVVASPDGRIGHLRGFSGMLGGRWMQDGFVPPLFDLDELDRFWPAGQAELARMELEHRATADASTLRSLETVRAARSKQLLAELHDSYVIEDALGRTRNLRSLFAPREPPGGAGDCAAPKLFGAAFRRGLRPLALAEFWAGPPPISGGRRAGEFYPACRGKCGPILPVMLAGLDVEPAPLYGADSTAIPDPRVLFEDDWLVVVDKPVGLLSVPGRHERLRDSVLVRLGVRFDPHIVHRLDLDTSGLMLVAKDRETHGALQKQFALRSIAKRYIAWLDGSPESDTGRVELALRADHDDRPRQIHDPVHGKPALTDWRVLERTATRTRVELVPHTGRTHQLRVHAAHPGGIGVPIVGDRLYGCSDTRLLLHAETLAFSHPRTGQRVELCSPAPF